MCRKRTCNMLIKEVVCSACHQNSVRLSPYLKARVTQWHLHTCITMHSDSLFE